MKLLSSCRPWTYFLLLLPVLFAVPVPRPGQAAESPNDAVAKAAAALYEGVRTETLPNGLRVYLKPVPGSAVIATMVAYKVGSADEELSQTGLSHYLEHLMFKGTDKIKPGDIDRVTQRNGGANNAYTDTDYTIFHFDFAAENWEVPLKIEADRMRNLRIDKEHEFEQEKGAVCAELDRDEDEAWDLEQKMIVPLLFGPKAPYGHPVIGERTHVHAATAAIIKAHYDKWYHPNNAALIVVGGFDPDKVMARIKELFGPIPRTELPARKEYTAVARTKPVRKEMASKFEVPRLLVGYNTVKSSDPDWYALAVLQGVLSSGKTSRLYKKFVDGEAIASSADAGNNGGRYPGWFAFQIELLKGKDLQKAEDLLLAELKRLRDEPVSEAELRRVKQQLVAGSIFARETVHDLADSIARGVTTNDLDYLKNYLTRINAVTAADVQKAAAKYFDPQTRVVIWSVPKKADAEKQGCGKAEKRTLARHAAGEKGGATGGFSLKNVQHVVLPNGLTLLLFENRRLPIVVAQAFVKDVRLHEPAEKAGVASLVGRLLDEGTTRHSGPEIAERIENVGGALSLNSNGATVKVLSPYRKLGLGLMFECLMEPTFPKDAFERQRDQMLSEIDEAEQKPEDKARQVYREMLYGAHPYGRFIAGTRKTVEALTPEDCKAFHQKTFIPNNTIVAIVGDFDARQIVDEIMALTAGWKKGDATKPKLPAPTYPEKFTEKIVTMPAAAQLHFFMGHPGIRRDNPDYYKLLVLDNVLGTGPGFTDRLSAKIRDRTGLAYTVNATIARDAGEEPGLFTCYVGTEPQNLAKVKGMFLEELNRIRDEPPTEVEVEDAKKYLIGNLPFSFVSNEQIASQLLGIERHHLGLGYFDDYRKAVAAVTPADVQAMAKKYLDPKRMVLVVAGAVDAKGEPLNKLPPPKK
jgi:zinc protease